MTESHAAPPAPNEPSIAAAAPRRFRRALPVLVALVPPVASAVASLWLVLANQSGSVRFTVPLPTILITGGLLVGAAIWVAWATRRAALARAARSHLAGVQAEREAHRRFLARLDHELKNPVTAIRAALEMAPNPSAELDVAAAQAARLATLIGELRSLSSLETAEIERTPVDLAAVVNDEVAAFREDLQARGVPRDVSVQLPSAPWPLPMVAGDADLLAVAVRNLLVNAAKYSDPGARIEVRGTDDGGFVLLEVADTGWGIAPEELPRVWDELWRGGAARRVDGSGLGLSLVRVVVDRHGGDVGIRSRGGSGTSVRLRIPAIRG